MEEGSPVDKAALRLYSPLLDRPASGPGPGPGSIDEPAERGTERRISVLPSTSIPLLRKKLAKALNFPSAQGVTVWTVRHADSDSDSGRPPPRSPSQSQSPAPSGREAPGSVGNLEKAAEAADETAGYWFSDGDTVWVDVG